MVGSHGRRMSGDVITSLRVKKNGEGVEDIYIKVETVREPLAPSRNRKAHALRHIAEHVHTREKFWDAGQVLKSNESGVDVHARLIPQACSQPFCRLFSDPRIYAVILK